MKDKWRSEEGILTILLLIPFTLLWIIPFISDEIKLRVAVPTNYLMETYINDKYISSSNVIDTSIELVRYNSAKKILDVNIKVIPEVFMEKQLNMEEVSESDDRFANYFMNNIYIAYIDLLTDLSNETIVPKIINVFGYWGDTQIMQIHYTRVNKKYKLHEPYPEIALIGLNDCWYLQYPFEGKKNMILIREINGLDFTMRIDEYIK